LRLWEGRAVCRGVDCFRCCWVDGQAERWWRNCGNGVCWGRVGGKCLVLWVFVRRCGGSRFCCLRLEVVGLYLFFVVL
jgi:hypothetical protein